MLRRIIRPAFIKYFKIANETNNILQARNFITPIFHDNTTYFSSAGAWCYNGEGTDPRWEYCDIPACTVPGILPS